MIANLLVTLPVFALILTGYLARRWGALGPGATREINRLVVWLALPALLFRIMAEASPQAIWQPGFIAAFSVGVALVFAGTIAVRRRAGVALADAAIDGLNAAYANTGFLGFPLALAIFGAHAMAPTLIATILTVSVLFAVAIVLIEIGLQGSGSGILRRTLPALLRNPLLIAPFLGLCVMASGLAMPGPVDRYLQLLGDAASPCALISLGLFLAGQAGQRPKAGPGVEGALIGLKLVVQPLVTYGTARVFGLTQDQAFLVTLLAALPTGTGPFMLAEFYGREALLTGRVVLKTTALSVLTISGLMLFA